MREFFSFLKSNKMLPKYCKIKQVRFTAERPILAPGRNNNNYSNSYNKIFAYKSIAYIDSLVEL